MKSTEWLAGILEGEGCFSEFKSGSSGFYTTPGVTITMTDGDVIDAVSDMFFMIGGRRTKVRKYLLPSGKPAFSIYLTGLPAAKVMIAVLPYMGERRSLKIKEIARNWSPAKYKEAIEFRSSIASVL